MKVSENASLRRLNTFGIEATAGLLVTIESEEDLLTLPALDPARDCVLGGGSNVVFVTDVPGTVYLNRIRGKAVVAKENGYCLVEAGAGEVWHELVQWTLRQDLSGLENLSLIPGLAGAAPIQNIGAYGVELAGFLDGVTAWDWKTAQWKIFDRTGCGLGYRDSYFKSEAPGRYLITSIRLRLNREFDPQLHYAGLHEELAARGISKPTAEQVSDAVIAIRRRKLPDPAVTGNAGSFFKNPVVDADRAERLLTRHPGLPAWPDGPGKTKLSAAWMIERCGLKGRSHGGAAVSDRHALVLVNAGSASGADVAALAHTVQQRVREMFGVELEPEPTLVGFSS